MRFNPLVIGGALIVAALAYVKIKGAGGMGAQIGGAAIDLADGVLSGAVVGTGQLVGIPATNQTACQRAIAEGRTWDASFACPAKEFINYVLG